MKIAAALVSLVAVATIFGSALSVINRDYEPRLSVNVTGVPGYVYYERAYDLSIEYANDGGAISGPIELTVQLPETFAIAEHVGDAARRGERLTWTLDGLDAGERGSLPLTVRGVLPDDLTNAVYDLPGYVGHTAFVEGFDLGVTLTAGDATASTQAVADTGVDLGGSLTISKWVDDDDEMSDQGFTFTTNVTGCETLGPLVDLVDNVEVGSSDPAVCNNVDWSSPVELREDLLPDWVLDSILCDGPNGDPVPLFENGQFNGIEIEAEPGANVSCTAFNAPGNLRVSKVCSPEPNEVTDGFSIQFLPEEDAPSAEATLDCGETRLLQVGPGEYSVNEPNPEPYTPSFGGDCEGGTIVVPPAEDGGTPVHCIVTNMAPAGIALLEVSKTCIGNLSGPYNIEVTRTGDLEPTASFTEVGCNEEEPFGVPIIVGEEYSVEETFNDDAEEVRYEGDCVQDGSEAFVMANSPEDVLSCEVINVNKVLITIEKVCNPEDIEGTFEISIYRTSDPGSPVGSAFLDCTGGASAGFNLEDATEYVIREENAAASVVYEGACIQDGLEAFLTADGEDVTCTVINSEPPVESESFQKYTTLEDEVVFLAEPFSWYIDVPAQEGYWTLIDVLPLGIGVVTVFDPDGVECIPYAIGIICFGGPSEETRTIEIIALGAPVCGDYYNVAKLITGLHSWEYADDTVTVCGPEQEEEIGPGEQSLSSLFSSGHSWWSRLWLSLFAR